MTKRELILNEIKKLPDSLLNEIFDFALFLKAKKIKSSDFFEAKTDLEKLAEDQGVCKITDFDKVLGDFWPEEENVDTFISTVEGWRQ